MGDSGLSPADHGGPGDFSGAAASVARLAELLESEFVALKSRDIEAFDALQSEKMGLLTRLSAHSDAARGMPDMPPEFADLQAPLAACRDAHQRNARLLEKMLDAIRGTLNALHGDGGQSVDLYDRMGRMARRLGAFGVHVA